MKKNIAILLLGLMLPLSVTAAEVAADFTLPTGTGAINLADQRGKVVYLDFWASWCIPCRKSFPWMNELQQRYGERGLKIIAINVDKDDTLVKRFLQEYPAQFTVAYDPDGTTANAYHVKGMPSSYVIDRQGRIQHSHIGFREVSKLDLESRIKAMLAQ